MKRTAIALLLIIALTTLIAPERPVPYVQKATWNVYYDEAFCKAMVWSDGHTSVNCTHRISDL